LFPKAGWKEVYEVSAPKQAKDFELEEKETKPPSRYTDG